MNGIEIWVGGWVVSGVFEGGLNQPFENVQMKCRCCQEPQNEMVGAESAVAVGRNEGREGGREGSRE